MVVVGGLRTIAILPIVSRDVPRIGQELTVHFRAQVEQRQATEFQPLWTILNQKLITKTTREKILFDLKRQPDLGPPDVRLGGPIEEIGVGFIAALHHMNHRARATLPTANPGRENPERSLLRVL